MSKFTTNQISWFKRWVRLLELDRLSSDEFRRHVFEECRLLNTRISRDEADEVARRVVARFSS